MVPYNQNIQNNYVMLRKKLIDLSTIIDLDNYVHSLDRWLEMSIHVRASGERQKYFDKFLKIVKPKVHKFHNLTSTLSNLEYGFYSKILRQYQIKVLVDAYDQLRPFQIFSQDEIASLEENGKYTYLSHQQINSLLAKPETEIYRIELGESPKNKELPFWGTYLEMESTTFESRVIHGKGIAKKSLGFPTANLEVTHHIEQKLNSYPNGIYLVNFTFANSESYHGVCSIGTNPHYQNSMNKRFVEVFVYHDFGEEQFYGAEITLQILVLMRFQGKFQTFDCFLNAMHNDIETGKHIGERYTAKL